jgi:hypothetical protein
MAKISDVDWTGDVIKLVAMGGAGVFAEKNVPPEFPSDLAVTCLFLCIVVGWLLGSVLAAARGLQTTKRVILVIGVLVLAFFGLVGAYSWQIKHYTVRHPITGDVLWVGNERDLNRSNPHTASAIKFEPKFSAKNYLQLANRGELFYDDAIAVHQDTGFAEFYAMAVLFTSSLAFAIYSFIRVRKQLAIS